VFQGPELHPSFDASSPPGFCSRSHEILLNKGMKYWDSALNAPGSRTCIVTVHIAAAVIGWKRSGKERTGQTQFSTKFGHIRDEISKNRKKKVHWASTGYETQFSTKIWFPHMSSFVWVTTSQCTTITYQLQPELLDESNHWPPSHILCECYLGGRCTYVKSYYLLSKTILMCEVGNGQLIYIRKLFYDAKNQKHLLS